MVTFAKITALAQHPQIRELGPTALRERNNVIQVQYATQVGGWAATTCDASKPIPLEHLVAERERRIPRLPLY
jgi:hypothetical protein